MERVEYRLRLEVYFLFAGEKGGGMGEESRKIRRRECGTF